MIVRKAVLLSMAALLALALVAAGCGGGKSSGGEQQTTGQQSADQGAQATDQGQQATDQGQQATDQAAQPADQGTQQAADQGSGGGDPAKGKDIYASKCAACHGANGEGAIGPGFISNSKVTTGATGDATKAVKDRLSEADHIKVVTDGRNAMPAFKGQLSDQEIKDVVAYERSFN